MTKKGFKQTECGEIPEDWECIKLGALASINTGNANTQDRVEGGIYPFFVRSQIVERINSYTFDGEAILTAGDGVGVGKVIHYVNGKFNYHQRVYKISDFKESHAKFVYFYLINNLYNHLCTLSAKNSVDSVRLEMLTDMLIPLPPLAEQRAIARALSDVDAL